MHSRAAVVVRRSTQTGDSPAACRQAVSDCAACNGACPAPQIDTQAQSAVDVIRSRLLCAGVSAQEY